MPISARRYKGKLKREIADEAFEELGPDATIKQVGLLQKILQDSSL
jgi:hypothetical protein